MTPAEDYAAKAAESLAAADAATTERDRLFHQRAHGIWKRLIAGIGEAEKRAEARVPPPRSKPASPR